METHKSDLDNNTNLAHHARPTDYEIEFYYRFFEELELSAEKGLISRYVIFNLFAYYALIGLEMGILKEYKSANSGWEILKRFNSIMQYNKRVKDIISPKPKPNSTNN